MLFSLTIFDLPRKRLILAVAGAFLTHGLFFGGGYLVLSTFLIPSDTTRALTLTLDSSLLDGVHEKRVETKETVNNTEVAKAKSTTKIPLVEDDVVDLTETPNLKDVVEQTDDLNGLSPDLLEAVTQTPIVETQEKSEHVDESVVLEVSDTPSEDPLQFMPEAEVVSERPPELASDDIKSANIIEPSIGFISDAIEQIGVLTALKGEIVAPTFVAPRELIELDEVVVTNVQQTMLQKKIERFAKTIQQPNAAQSVSWKHKGQTYFARFKHLPATDEMEMDEIRVDVITEQNGRKLSKQMRMKKLAFSNFAQFVHRWDSDIRVHDDEFEGRFHSNSKFYVSPSRKATPVFSGKVTTASYTVDVDRVSRRLAKDSIFLGGLETGVKKIRMPKPRLLYADKPATNDDNTVLFEQDTRIIFTADGRYVTQNLDAPEGASPLNESVIGNDPNYLLGAAGVTLYVSGTLKGKVLLYSAKSIVIEGSLIYAESGGKQPHDSFLGMVSDRDIVVAGPNVTGPGDLKIDAAIYAKRRFKIKNHTDKNKAMLTIYGSLTSGTIGATEPRYATNVVFDKRLEDVRPPGYPVSDRYELALSDDAWKVDTVEQAPPFLQPSLK